jgi:MFS family permease
MRGLWDSSRAILRQHNVFRLAVLGQFLFLFGIYPVSRFLLFFLRDRFGSDAVSRATLGVVIAIVVGIVAATLAGRLSDKIGRKPVLVGSVLTGALGVAGLGFTEALSLAYVAGSVIAVGVGSFQAVNWALLSDDLPDEERATALGISNISIAGASALVGLFGPLVDLLDKNFPAGTWQITFGLGALFSLSSLLAIRRLPSSDGGEAAP